ncbi:MAG: LPS export ABC transporter periplasmic protein LptC [Hoeflea sp.]
MLEVIQADLPVSAGETAVLEATSATYDREGETLVFSEPFKVMSDGGFSAEMQSANIDMATSEMSTSDPVTIRSGDASVVAKSMKMQDKGRLIILEDQVRMTINPSAIRSPNRETN